MNTEEGAGGPVATDVYLALARINEFVRRVYYGYDIYAPDSIERRGNSKWTRRGARKVQKLPDRKVMTSHAREEASCRQEGKARTAE